MNHYTHWHALIGGMLIGPASLIATALTPKVPGISAVFGRLLVPATPDKAWRLVFLIGLIGSAALSFSLWESAPLFRFLDVFGKWDPALLFVMSGAVAVYAIGMFAVRRSASRTLNLPSAETSPIDRRLVIGAAIFGVGWGLGGFCAGPALANLGALRTDLLVFVPAMAIAMVLAQRFHNADR